jgi:hypothetical protein
MVVRIGIPRWQMSWPFIEGDLNNLAGGLAQPSPERMSRLVFGITMNRRSVSVAFDNLTSRGRL